MTPLVIAKDAAWGIEDRLILQDINLALQREEFFVIMGANGSGKTSLLKLLAGLTLPARGSVDAVVKTGARLGMREAIGRSLLRAAFVFQVGGLISNLNVFDNVALPLRYHDYLPEPRVRELVSVALEEFGLNDWARKRPGSLTPGLEKRVQIARAKVVEADIIFYDNPQLGLDAVQTRLVHDAILKLHQEQKHVTVLTSDTPDWALTLANRVALMDNGRIESLGTVKELLQDPSSRAHEFLKQT